MVPILRPPFVLTEARQSREESGPGAWQGVIIAQSIISFARGFAVASPAIGHVEDSVLTTKQNPCQRGQLELN
jgi:hypothetical protein